MLSKNPRDVIQFATLARQMYPNDYRFAVEAYGKAPSVPYGYLLMDLKPEQDDQYRLRIDIFPGDNIQFVYVKK